MTYKPQLLEIIIVLLLAACIVLAFYAHSATQLQAERIANDCLTHGKALIDGVPFKCEKNHE